MKLFKIDKYGIYILGIRIVKKQWERGFDSLNKKSIYMKRKIFGYPVYIKGSE